MGLKPHQFRHRIDYAEDGIEPASCGFPDLSGNKHSSSLQRHMPWTMAYKLGADYKVALPVHWQSTSNLRLLRFGSVVKH